MARPSGYSKTGGRKKGTPNKSSIFLKEELENRQINLIERLFSIIPVLSVEKQCEVYLKLLEYVYPKRKSLETNSDEDLENKPKVIVYIPSNGREVKLNENE